MLNCVFSMFIQFISLGDPPVPDYDAIDTAVCELSYTCTCTCVDAVVMDYMIPAAFAGDPGRR